MEFEDTENANFLLKLLKSTGKAACSQGRCASRSGAGSTPRADRKPPTTSLKNVQSRAL